MRLIDADELKKKYGYTDEWYKSRTVAQDIDNSPTVSMPDFKEGYKQAIIDGKTNFSRPQGEWIFDGFCVTTTQYKCNKCKCPTLEKTNFCPNCGAKMKGVMKNECN